MEVYQNYKKYREYVPEYKQWKEERNNQEAKRLEYIKRNPDAVNKDDLQRSKALLHAIDVMDEYSQKNAEDMEVATEMAAGQAIEVVNMAGLGAGMLTMALPPVSKGLNSLSKKYPKLVFPIMMIPTAIGYVASIVASFPIMAWAAKTQVGASRQGRFEAMRKDLNNPNSFAVLTDEQLKQAQNDAQNITIPEENEKKDLINLGFKDVFKNLKKLVKKDKEYEKQRAEFDKKLKENEKHFNDSLSEKDIQKAKRDRQLLTKLVEKIDIASQDYAENAELGVSALITAVFAFSSLMDMGLTKLMTAMKVKSASVISTALKVFTVAATAGTSIASASISKEASRIGRFKIKDYLSKHPESLVYVPDEATGEISDVEIEGYHKPGFFHFMRHVWGDNRRYQKYKKNEANDEKRFYKALENIEITPEQEKDAKRLQKNTFMTFNKVDHNSQKYSESVEALGQSVSYPIISVASLIGAVLGTPYLFKSAKGGFEQVKNFSKYFSIIILSTLPSMAINAYITQKQKRASRVADMLSIKELGDYRNFIDYSEEFNKDKA